jgi:flavodoxin
MIKLQMKVLVVFYSFEGNTKLIAENIAKAIDADILELKPKKEIIPKGFMKYFWGGKAAIMKATPELLPIEKNPQNYDILFIGTPVWAFTYAPPLNTFFSTSPVSNKKIALFCCHGGAKGRTFDKMKEALKGNQILSEINFRDPLKRNTSMHTQIAREWAENIIKTL